ncbi:L,D-transpeptidase [Rhodoblastus acidophilus]|uniref:L,D-transpeptidase n=1 Tax=Candidatus Rhodoblastus alkanivorans TaxID=2954117 RepID=A0ABS9Z1E3_9HYPH|nr:L,D-transpeptidase [Candidatus Rhodoblastus alkanivorans]MCI4679425.1 L,D-transpeptidase [Candidatus Rhodoblastus alkanivorans]MCI4681433.1 L,D-transpeptidase [Candidatus Rhodoblastus alkanivorans]MDI4642481.1 L,D-transpeptidase [Rhodoblastus acidophilus]
MRKLAQLLLVFATFLIAPAALARVQISINLSTQRMDVRSSDGQSYSWPISSARAGYVTPRGVYSATSLQRMHYSKKYHNSPMPHSIFFRGGYAIHGTYATRSLGRPASHGCVRISPANAAQLYSLVRAEGATIRISGSPPPSRPFASEWRDRKHHHHYAYNAGRHHRHYAHYAGRPYHSSVMSYAPTRQGTYPAGIFGVVLSQ